jgi:nitrite reductase (NAD(P)H)
VALLADLDFQHPIVGLISLRELRSIFLYFVLFVSFWRFPFRSVCKMTGEEKDHSSPSEEDSRSEDDFVASAGAGRKRVVVVGLGMVGIAFIEKLMKLDEKRREYDVIVIGEEPHLAYNRVGLTSFFQHRNVEDLYLNPASWYTSMPEGSLNYHLNTLVNSIDTENKIVGTSSGDTVPYDILVLATGSDAILPRHTPGHDANGVFVYRTIEDLQKLIKFAGTKRGTVGAVVGGGLLGLEAAKAMMDLDEFSKVKLIERNKWVMSRQLDGDASSMVVEQVQQLGLDVLLSKRVQCIDTDDENNLTGVTFEDGDKLECTTICFAIGIQPRDDLARKSGKQTTFPTLSPQLVPLLTHNYLARYKVYKQRWDGS